jgi:hypothetical protein
VRRLGLPKSQSQRWSTRRPASRRRRTVTGTPPRIPFFAQTTGPVPRHGRSPVAGYRLPPGDRAPDSDPTYWISEEPIALADIAFGDLVREYPQTGVWPLLWAPSEDPQGYIQHAGDADLVDTVNVEDRLRHRWETYAPVNLAAIEPYDATFPGLAHGPAATADLPGDPFADLTATAARLMLVACNRPADAVALIGALTAETSGTTISAMLRAWEERFQATLIAVGLREAWISIQAPPTDPDEALHLAAEHWTFCPPEGTGQPGSLRSIASALLGHATERQAIAHDLTPTRWRIAW